MAGETVVDSINEALNSVIAADMLFESLAKLYMLAAELEDFITVNLVMDEVIRLSADLEKCSLDESVSLALCIQDLRISVMADVSSMSDAEAVIGLLCL